MAVNVQQFTNTNIIVTSDGLSLRQEITNGKLGNITIGANGSTYTFPRVVTVNQLYKLLDALQNELGAYYEDPANYTMKG